MPRRKRAAWAAAIGVAAACAASLTLSSCVGEVARPESAPTVHATPGPAGIQRDPCETTPRIEGSIVQPDGWLARHPDAAQSAVDSGPAVRRWRSEFAVLDRACVTDVLIQWTAATDGHGRVTTAYYPTTLASDPTIAAPGLAVRDVVSPVLDAAAEFGDMNVYLGLQSPHAWASWSLEPGWAAREAARSQAIAEDIWSRYRASHAAQIRGWFLTPELDSSFVPVDAAGHPASKQEFWSGVADYYDRVARFLHELTPGMPVIVAPTFGPHATTTSAFRDLLRAVMRADIDVVMVQDRTGEDPTVIDRLPGWYAAARTEVDTVNRLERRAIELWTDTETYRVGPQWTAADIGDIVAAMKAVRPYVSRTFSFSFSHWLSPQGVTDQAGYAQYLDYLRTGTT